MSVQLLQFNYKTGYKLDKPVFRSRACEVWLVHTEWERHEEGSGHLGFLSSSQYLSLDDNVASVRAGAHKVCTLASNICGPSVCKFLHVTLLAHRILRRFLAVWKLCASLRVCMNMQRSFWEICLSVCQHLSSEPLELPRKWNSELDFLQ